MDGHCSDVQCLFKNRQKTDSFAAYFGQQFKSTIYGVRAYVSVWRSR